ncbi:uncharacterized protein LOC5514519 [Nematostella vectensis]|uniref:uncharacterized protein LOC5514519 n=1 Tax=Nematostella vectensis TaxID=45351 RepID=UPI00207761AF|nr:uncharacterized protein LOC5514519 [Nematostella vectensis]
MPLLLEHCGMNLRSASITIAILSMFFTGYRVIKDAVMIVALKDIEDDAKQSSEDLPRHAIPTLLQVLYMGISVAGLMCICSFLLLMGTWKKIYLLVYIWIPVSVIYILVDLSVIIYLGVTYVDVSTVAVTIGIACVWYAVHIYCILVVILFFKTSTGRYFPGSDYENINVIT